MPYSMIVVVPPVPDADDEAWDWVEALDEALFEKRTPLDVSLRIFVEELVKTYPRSSSLPPERHEECVWAEEPLESNGYGALLHVALSGRHNIDSLCAFIVALANRMNLVVFDGPGGRILRAPRWPH